MYTDIKKKSGKEFLSFPSELTYEEVIIAALFKTYVANLVTKKICQ